MVSVEDSTGEQPSKKKLKYTREPIAFNDDDMEGTIQPHDDALVVLVLVHAMRKLPHYFQAHTVYVLTEYPLKSLLKRSDCTGRIAKWGTRLGSFDIRYKPRSLVKC